MGLPTRIYADPNYRRLRIEFLAAKELFNEVLSCDDYLAAQALRFEAASNLYAFIASFPR